MATRRPPPSLDAFLAREGDEFTVHRSDGPDVDLRLEAVERPATPRDGWEQFTLRFQSVDGDHVPQGLYTVSSGHLDPFDVTIVPVTRFDDAPGAVSYEAVFSRRAPDGDRSTAMDDGPTPSRRGVLAGALGALVGGSLLAGALGSPVGRAEAVDADSVFMGEIRAFVFKNPPSGWAQCNGQLMPVSQNPELDQLLGTTYGGDGQTTFGLPDLRGRTPIHHGQGPGLTSRAMGQRGGDEEVALSTANLPAHDHDHQLTLPTSSDEGNAVTPDGNALAAQPDARGTVPVYTDGATDGSMNVAGDVESTGSGDAFDNMPPYTVVNYCIALEGADPTV